MLRKIFRVIRKSIDRNKFNKYIYLLKYIKEKDILCKKLYLEENNINYV